MNNSNSWWLTFIASIAVATPVNAEALDLTQASATLSCGSDGKLDKIQYPGAHLDFSTIPKTRNRSDTISIGYPIPGPNASIAGDYSTDLISKVVNLAVKNGVDPYMAVAIVLLENSKALRERSNKYETQKGLLPIDGRTVADQLGCAAKPQNKVSKGEGLPLSPLDPPPEISINEVRGSGSALYCAGANSIKVGDPFPLFQPRPKDKTQHKCCFRYSPANATAVDVFNHFAINYLKTNVQDFFSKDQTIPLTLQRYQGKGYFGLTQKIQQPQKIKGQRAPEPLANCFVGLNGKDRPIYGERAADLMLMSLMPNKQLAQIVQSELAKNDKPVSGFCLAEGKGDHSHRLVEFADLQREQLLSGVQKFPFYKAILSTGGTFPPPKDVDLDTKEYADNLMAYRDAELARAEKCARLFKKSTNPNGAQTGLTGVDYKPPPVPAPNQKK